jgi:hypothetical protein
MTSRWLHQFGRTVWKGHAFSFLFYVKQDTKSLGKRPRFVKTLSNTSAFTCPRGNTGSALRGNRLYVPSLPLRLTGLLVKITWWLAILPACPSNYCCPGDRADKLTLGQELTVLVPHSVLTHMEYKGNYWLANSQMVKYIAEYAM